MVGTEFPAITLPNSRDETINLQDFLGKKNLVVILLRGIMWPYCRAHVLRLGKKVDEFVKFDAEIIAILTDKAKNAKKMEEKYAKNKIPIYYDTEKKVGKLLKQEWAITKLGRMPAMLIVNKQGIVKWAYYSDSMSDIPKNQEILEFLETLK